MANDAKWVKKEVDLEFVAYAGMTFENAAEDQPLRVTSVAYDFEEKYFKVRLGWLSPTPLTSSNLLKLGWELNI